MRVALAGALTLTALAGSVPAQPRAPRPPATQCKVGETALYSCRFGRKHGSVCAAPGRVAYRFGPLGKPELEIASAPDWSNVRIGGVVGGGGGYQKHLRFTADGHDYVVYDGVAGQYTEIPGKRWNGIVVQQGESELANLACRHATVLPERGVDESGDWAPEAVKETLADDDPRFDAWF